MAVPGGLQRRRPEVFFSRRLSAGTAPPAGGNGQELLRPLPCDRACLQHALSVRESHGVWGGLSTDERRARLGEQIAS